MAKGHYQCAKCGTGLTITGHNRADADRKAAWAQQQGLLCSSCKRAEFAAEHEAAITAAAADPLTATLPALTGSEKQVAWAQSLRLQALPVIDQARDFLLQSVARQQGSDAGKREIADAIQLITVEMRDRTDASDWIDNKGATFEMIARQIQRQLAQRAAILCPTAVAEKAARAQQ